MYNAVIILSMTDEEYEDPNDQTVRFCNDQHRNKPVSDSIVSDDKLGDGRLVHSSLGSKGRCRNYVAGVPRKHTGGEGARLR